jgi:CheY-like chemotaxis protein
MFGVSILPTPDENRLRKAVPPARPLVLLIEDDEMGLTLRKAVLRADGYYVIGVTSADDALTALREGSISVTIADHMLQGTTGVELAKKMKKIKPHVPIILFSGTLPEQLEGVDIYIHKGEPTTEFLRIVREVVQRYCS